MCFISIKKKESLSLPDVHINFRLYIKNTCRNETSKNTNGWNPSNLGDLVSLNWERNPNWGLFVMGLECVCVCGHVCVCVCTCTFDDRKKTDQWRQRRSNPHRIQWLDWNSKNHQIFTIRFITSSNDITFCWVLNCTGFYTSDVLPHARNHMPHWVLSKLSTAL